jgi:hypothetical protein
MHRHGRHQSELGPRRHNYALYRLLVLVTHTVSRPILDTALTLLLGFGESVTHVSIPRARRVFTRRSEKLLQRNVKCLTNLFKSFCHALEDLAFHLSLDQMRNLLFHGFLGCLRFRCDDQVAERLGICACWTPDVQVLRTWGMK